MAPLPRASLPSTASTGPATCRRRPARQTAGASAPRRSRRSRRHLCWPCPMPWDALVPPAAHCLPCLTSLSLSVLSSCLQRLCGADAQAAGGGGQEERSRGAGEGGAAVPAQGLPGRAPDRWVLRLVGGAGGAGGAGRCWGCLLVVLAVLPGCLLQALAAFWSTPVLLASAACSPTIHNLSLNNPAGAAGVPAALQRRRRRGGWRRCLGPQMTTRPSVHSACATRPTRRRQRVRCPLLRLPQCRKPASQPQRVPRCACCSHVGLCCMPPSAVESSPLLFLRRSRAPVTTLVHAPPLLCLLQRRRRAGGTTPTPPPSCRRPPRMCMGPPRGDPWRTPWAAAPLGTPGTEACVHAIVSFTGGARRRQAASGGQKCVYAAAGVDRTTLP